MYNEDPKWDKDFKAKQKERLRNRKRKMNQLIPYKVFTINSWLSFHEQHDLENGKIMKAHGVFLLISFLNGLNHFLKAWT